ncbi:MAG: hypothetical protein PHE02_14375 [Lachnospiraceae bacterium]|nr:hypothetical protein [Lachnospiraceae bacterium]
MEREEAIQYYNDYFDDAGEENEGVVIGELGSPQKVAETIKTDLMGKNAEDWEFTEAGCTNMGGRPKAAVAKVENGENTQQAGNRYQNEYGNQYNGSYNHSYENGAPAKRKPDTGKIILIVLLVIVTSPLWMSVGGALIGLIVSVIAVLAALLLAFVLLTIACIVGGLLLFGISFVKMMVSPLLGFMTMGIGLLMLGVGLLALTASVWICGKVIPVLFIGMINLCRKPFQKNKNQVQRGGETA